MVFGKINLRYKYKTIAREELQMKENYVTPEAKVIVLLEEDIVTLSSEDFYDNGENDQVWD